MQYNVDMLLCSEKDPFQMLSFLRMRSGSLAIKQGKANLVSHKANATP